MSWFAVSFASVLVTFLACKGKAVSHRRPLSGQLRDCSSCRTRAGRDFSVLSSPQPFIWSSGMEDPPAGTHLSLGTVLQQLSEQPHHHHVKQQPEPDRHEPCHCLSFPSSADPVPGSLWNLLHGQGWHVRASALPTLRDQSHCRMQLQGTSQQAHAMGYQTLSWSGSMTLPHYRDTVRHPLSPGVTLLHLQLGRCRNPKVSSSCRTYLCYKLVLFPELLWSPLLDGLSDRAQHAVGVGASAAEGPVFFEKRNMQPAGTGVGWHLPCMVMFMWSVMPQNGSTGIWWLSVSLIAMLPDCNSGLHPSWAIPSLFCLGSQLPPLLPAATLQ